MVGGIFRLALFFILLPMQWVSKGEVGEEQEQEHGGNQSNWFHGERSFQRKSLISGT
jgi:hypothetical protein